MKRPYSIEIKGKGKRWSFPVMAEPEHVADWCADGLDVRQVYGTTARTNPLPVRWVMAWQAVWQWLRLW